MKTKSKKEKALNSKGREKIREKMKKEKALANDAKETTLKIKNINTQTNTEIKKSINKEKK